MRALISAVHALFICVPAGLMGALTHPRFFRTLMEEGDTCREERPRARRGALTARDGTTGLAMQLSQGQVCELRARAHHGWP
jgi:hypothetical protein